MFDLIRRDIQRYLSLESRGKAPGLGEKLRILADQRALSGVAIYRFGAWVKRELEHTTLRYPLLVAYHVADKVSTMLWGLHIDPNATIGGGLYIPSPGGIHIGPVKMGSDCNVGPNVTVGHRADGKGHGATPTIGDCVWIGTGSVVFGGISVGNGASIGPLTVVARNLPPHCMVSGNPMQILSLDYDNSVQIYGKSGPPGDHFNQEYDKAPATIRSSAREFAQLSEAHSGVSGMVAH